MRLPLAEATLLQYTNPLWAAALAALALGERVGPREALALALGLTGGAMVIGPGLGAAGPGAGAAAVGLLGAACSAAAYVVIRRMGAAEDPRRVTIYLPLVFAAAWGWLAFGDRPGAWAAAGAATIVAGTLALAADPARRGAPAGPPPAALAGEAGAPEAPLGV